MDSADGTGMDSPNVGFSTEENSHDTIEPEEKKKKGRNPVLMMVVVLGVGLLVSLAYLGGRISSAHASVAAAKPAAFAEASGAADGDRSLTVAARKDETPVAVPAAKASVTPVAVKEVAKAAPVAAPVVVKEVAKVPPPATAVVAKDAVKATPAVAPVVAKAVTKSVAAEESSAQLFQPKAGVAYVQVGAFVSPYAQNWVSVLKQRGFNPVVAEGPNPAVHRVLLGPFGPAEVAEVETKLRAAGIDHFERVY